MSKDKISSQEMVDMVASKLSVSKRVAEEFLKSLFAEIEEALLKGEQVKVKNLGTFKMQWNEPRKSVNVQTGEVIVIEGYNKVSFTPDGELKDAVNEPYSHLESVELDGVMPDFEIEKPAVGNVETLKNLTEQATEIKDILSEINAMSVSHTVEKPTSEVKTPIEIPDYDLILLDEEADSEPESIEKDKAVILPDNNNEEQVVEISRNSQIESETVSETIPETNAEFAETVFSEPIIELPKAIQVDNEFQSRDSEKDAVKEDSTASVVSMPEPFIIGKKKKRKGLRIVIGLVITLAILFGTIYAVYFSSSCIRCWVQYDLLSEANRQKVSEYTNTFKGWFTSEKQTTKPAQQKADSIPNNQSEPVVDSTDTEEHIQTSQTATPKDSLQMLFDSKREYTEFLGEEKIEEGMRLTTIAQRYYGKRDFWVYIYEANKDNIVHPDRIAPGTIVKIPRVDPRLIDKKNPRCIAKAKELHDLYVGKK